MKKLVYVILILAVIGGAFTLLANRASGDKDLAQKISSLIENGETRINLTEITDFKWNQIAVFDPYTSNSGIEDAMGITFKGDNGNIDMLDNRFLLVFADDKYAVRTVVLSRDYGVYSTEDNTFLRVKR